MVLEIVLRALSWFNYKNMFHLTSIRIISKISVVWNLINMSMISHSDISLSWACAYSSRCLFYTRYMQSQKHSSAFANEVWVVKKWERSSSWSICCIVSSSLSLGIFFLSMTCSTSSITKMIQTLNTVFSERSITILFGHSIYTLLTEQSLLWLEFSIQSSEALSGSSWMNASDSSCHHPRRTTLNST